MRQPYEILIKPVITEKALGGAAQGEAAAAQYTFEVAPDANKIEIRYAIETSFNVRVAAVNTVRVKGKRKRLRSPKLGRRPERKKAVVTLEPGQTIDLV